MAIVLMILGFIAWWPIGLLILAFLLARGRLGYWRGPAPIGGPAMHCWDHGADRWEGRVQKLQDRWEGKLHKLQDKMDRVRDKMGRFGSSSEWRGGQGPSGNRAFDEYREETLRRLEEEQREFREFLERLRFAKDKTEFDQFMAERRNRAVEPAPAPQG